MDNPPDDLITAMAEAPPHETPDRLTLVREKVAQVRDLTAEVADLEARTKAANKQLQDLYFKELPDLFAEAGVNNLGLDAEGNLPAVDARLKPYYKANISADWPMEKRADGFAFLREKGAGDLIKTVITIELGRGEEDTVKEVCDFLEEEGIAYKRSLAVAWMTLTAWLKEQAEKKRREFTPAQLDKIGGRVGKVVEVKSRRA